LEEKALKLMKSLKSVTILSSVAMLALAIGGCGSADNTSTSPDAAGVGGSSSSFTVTKGASQTRTVKGSGKISFTVVGIDMDLDKDKQPIVFFYDAKGYGSGRTTGGFQGELRNFKLKYYGTSGQIESESYHGTKFRSTESYNITLEWKTGNDGYVQSTINGSVFQRGGGVADTFTLGIGYPPGGVSGWDGAVYTNIKWP
jgi:hypothetical protein